MSVVFEATRAHQPMRAGHYITYDQITELDANDDSDYFGEFNPRSGKFIVGCPGLYFFMFQGLAHPHTPTSVRLCVDGVPKAFAEVYEYTNGPEPHGHIVLSTMLLLDTGSTVGVFIERGSLYDTGNSTRFTGVLHSA